MSDSDGGSKRSGGIAGMGTTGAVGVAVCSREHDSAIAWACSWESSGRASLTMVYILTVARCASAAGWGPPVKQERQRTRQWKM